MNIGTATTPPGISETPAGPIKAGWKTTEFWTTQLSTVGLILGMLAGVLPPSWAAIATAISQGAYAISRGFAKKTA